MTLTRPVGAPSPVTGEGKCHTLESSASLLPLWEKVALLSRDG